MLVVVSTAALLCCRGTTFPGRLVEATPTATATATATPSPQATVTDMPVPLKADCGSRRYSVSAGTPIVFDGRGSTSPHGPMRAYQWDFGDGTIGQGVTPTHIYRNDEPNYGNTSTRRFIVTLTIVDAMRETASCTTECVVYAYY